MNNVSLKNNTAMAFDLSLHSSERMGLVDLNFEEMENTIGGGFWAQLGAVLGVVAAVLGVIALFV